MKQNKAHAVFGASSSHRWMNCPGSVALIDKAPEPVESPYAKEGTDAHGCLEKFLREYVKADRKLAPLRLKLASEHGTEMASYAWQAFEWIRNEYEKTVKGSQLLCETKIDASSFTCKGQFGTVDAAIVEEFGDLVCIDFKYGAGIAVDPFENSQLIYYALGLAHKFDYNFQRVRIIVIQPRAYSDEGPVKEWTTDIKTLKVWAEKFKKAVKAAKKKDARLFAHESHCRFCPAAPICPALSDQAFESAKLDFAMIEDEKTTLPDLKETLLDSARIAKIMEASPKIRAWLDAVEEHAFNELNSGKKIPGFKLVEKRGIRKWINEEETKEKAKNLFGLDALSDPKLLSPAQLEKISKDAESFVKDHAIVQSSGLTLVPESDKRKEVNKLQMDFDSLNDETTAEGELKNGDEKSDKKAQGKTESKKLAKVKFQY